MNRNGPAGFWSGCSVGITGATGFVGGHLAGQLAQMGARVTAVVRPTAVRWRLEKAGVRCIEASLDEPAAIGRAFRGCEFVFHLAAAVDFENDWHRFRQVNIEGTRHVAAAARWAGVRRFIHTSSIVAVGANRHPRVLDETARWDLNTLRVPYVTTKRLAEEWVLSASGRDLEVVVVNPASVVGPDDFSASEFGTLCRRFWRGRIPVHFGGGNNFVDVRDVASGLLLAAQHGRPGQRYLLGGSNRSYTAFFADLARIANRPIFRVRIPIAVGAVVAHLNERFRRGPKGRSYLTSGQARLLSLFFYFDSGKAQRELGYHPRPLANSLADTYTFWMGKRSA